MRGKRVFIAVDPTAEAVARAARIVTRLQGEGVAASWVGPAEMHLTLNFLGDDVGDADLHRICLCLTRWRRPYPRFRSRSAASVSFPTRRPRVLWLGVEHGRERLVGLHDALARRFEPLGFPPEGRGFQPHVTLGRFRRGGKASPPATLAAALERSAESGAGDVPVKKIVLYESRLSTAGAEYDRLHAAALAGP